MELICSCCKNKFEISKSEYTKSVRKGQENFFCSRSCYFKYRSDKSKSELSCHTCKKLFLRTNREVRKDSPNFCSKSCAATHNNKGKRRTYKTGRSVYRDLALKNKDSKCFICGFSEFYALEVHHLDSNRDNNELENLVVLCANCHRGVHKVDSIRNKLHGASMQVG